MTTRDVLQLASALCSGAPPETELHDVEAEQDVLGIVMADPAAAKRAERLLNASDFFDPLHGQIFSLAGTLRANGQAVTGASIADCLVNSAALFDCGGVRYLQELVENAYQRRDLKDAAETVRHWSEKRRAVDVLGEAFDRLSDPQTLLSDCLAQVAPLTRWAQREDRSQTSLEDARPETARPSLLFNLVAAWAERPIPPMQWIAKDRIPARNVTLLSGDGGTGKSTIAQQLAVASCLGREWLGVPLAPGPAMGLHAEEDEDELHRRFEKIAAYYDVRLSALTGLHVKSLAGRDAVLAAPDRQGMIRPTDLFDELLEEARRIRPRILTIDNAADVYAGDENDRAQVRQFIGLLRRLSIDVDTAVILTAHPSLSGLQRGSGLSGSTAWHASVRSRLYLKKTNPESGEQDDPDERVLVVMKSNYGPAGETIPMRWKDGVFVPTARAHWPDKRAAENVADDLFLRLLASFDRQGRNVSDKPSASYAPSLFAKDPDAVSRGVKKPAFVGAMARLFAAGKIHVDTYGRPSRPNSKLALGPRP